MPENVLPDKIVHLHLVADGQTLKTIEMALPTIECVTKAISFAAAIARSQEFKAIAQVLLTLALQSKPPAPAPTTEPNPNGGNLQHAN